MFVAGTSNRQIASAPSFGCHYVGLDWADRKHDFCLQQAGNNALEFGILEHTPEAIEQWARALQIRFGGPIAICLETTKGPLVNALLRYEYLVLFPVHAATQAGGNRCWVHWRFACSTFLRQTFVEWALQSLEDATAVQ